MNGVYYGYTLQVIRKNKEKHLKNMSCQGNQPQCVVSSCKDYMTIPKTNIKNIPDTVTREKNVKALEDAVTHKLTIFDDVLNTKNYV